MQFLTGQQIQAAQIPFLPDAANIIKAWFAPLPLSASTYYIPGAILATTPASIGIDPSSGAAPSVGTGLVFAINPCTQEYHFGIQVWCWEGPGSTRSACVKCAPTTFWAIVPTCHHDAGSQHPTDGNPRAGS